MQVVFLSDGLAAGLMKKIVLVPEGIRSPTPLAEGIQFHTPWARCPVLLAVDVCHASPLLPASEITILHSLLMTESMTVPAKTLVLWKSWSKMKEGC